VNTEPTHGMTERRRVLRRGLAAPALHFDLRAKLEELRSEHGYEAGDHLAATLVKEPDFRIVLIALKAGGRLKEHHADARISIQAIEGLVRMRLPDGSVELPPGHILALEPNIPHDVEAEGDSAILLTIALARPRKA
jgi:quercetin dioxygenase-like cupin family protein